MASAWKQTTGQPWRASGLPIPDPCIDTRDIRGSVEGLGLIVIHPPDDTKKKHLLNAARLPRQLFVFLMEASGGSCTFSTRKIISYKTSKGTSIHTITRTPTHTFIRTHTHPTSHLKPSPITHHPSPTPTLTSHPYPHLHRRSPSLCTRTRTRTRTHTGTHPCAAE